MIKIILVSLFLSLSVSAAQNADILINQFDKKLYNPKNLGLKRLFFEARISGLTESIKSKTIIENINEIYFEVNWNSETGFTITVIGLPKGFKQIKYQLKMLLADKLYFFIPLKIKNSVKGYTPKVKKDGDLTYITMTDSTNEKNISKVLITIDAEGKINTIESSALTYRTKTTMFMAKEKWSRSKWAMNELTIENFQNNINSSTTYQLSYEQIKNFSFPKTIDILTEIKTVPSSNTEQSKVLGRVKSQINFSKFKLK